MAPEQALVSHQRGDRRLQMLRRMGHFGEPVPDVAIYRATSHFDLSQAYCLVHDVFVEAGYINRHPSGMRLRIFEALPEMATFIAQVGDSIVGVLSVVEDSPDVGLPCGAAFGRELEAVRASGGHLCEITNQAVIADFRKTAVATELMRCAVAHCLARGCQRAIATVSPSHHAMYRLLGFSQIGDVRSYSRFVDDPVVALSVNAQHYCQPSGQADRAQQFIRDFMVAENPFNTSVKFWDTRARQQFLNVHQLRQLFVYGDNLLQRTPAPLLDALRRRWGAQRYDQVMQVLRTPAQGRLIA